MKNFEEMGIGEKKDFISNKLDRENIKNAIESGAVKKHGDEENPRRESDTHFMIYKNEKYSPKYVITKTYEFVYGEKLETSFTPDYADKILQDKGFEIEVDENNREADNGKKEDVKGEINMSDQNFKNQKADEYKTLVDEGRVEFITFHPSYSYEEFIEGITVNSESDGESDLNYMIKDGVFKRVCARALACALGKDEWEKYGNIDKVDDEKNKVLDAENGKYIWNNIHNEYKENGDVDWNEICEDKSKRFLLIIDEINRGDISKIFGELITLIENDKRLGASEEKVARLTYSSQEFAVPPNVYILGTMNTADRSIAMLDVALRRRFSFEGMYPNEGEYEKLRAEFDIEDPNEDSPLAKSIKKLKKINQNILSKEKLGRDKMIGQSYFYQVNDNDDFDEVKRVWFHEVFPLLEEYCWDDMSTLRNIVETNETNIYNSEEKRLSRSREQLEKWLEEVTEEK